VAALCGALPAAAQTTNHAPAPPPAAAQPAPDFIDKVLNMVGFSEPKPQTARQKFEQYVWNTIGPVPLVGEAAGAGINQWSDTPHEWRQGWEAYGKRYGSNLAYNAVRQTVMYGISIPLGEDNRYYASRSKGIWPRTRHAVLSTFEARHADGRTTFSVSATAGVVAAASISSIWLPPSQKRIPNIASNAGISFGTTAAFNVVREFLPDLLHRPRR
jgi:hypothetical protein